MKKELRFNAIFIVSILFLSIFVSAISTGEGGSNTSDEDNNSNLTSNTTREETNRTVNKTRTQIRKLPELRDYNCEDFDERSDRIKCRLINRELAKRYNENNNIIPEACKLAENKGRCVALYRTTQTCYKLEGRAKDACLKRAIGLRKAHFNETQNYTERQQHAREYIVTLLYNLEWRVEKQLENGNITEEEATQLIDKIVEIKALILNNGTKREVRVDIEELKNMWRGIIKDKVECSSEKDCVDIGKCKEGIECTCYKNKCKEGYIYDPTKLNNTQNE